MSSWSHVFELRARLLRFFWLFVLVSTPLIFYASPWYGFVAIPLTSLHPGASSMIATAVTTPFTAPIKLALVSAFCLVLPYGLYQIWAFVASGLYPKERRVMRPIMLLSPVLFYAGMSLAFFVVCPLALRFFHYIAPPGITVMTDIQHYLNFILSLMFAFGIAFQTPIITWLTVKLGWLNVKQLRAARPYVVVGSFVMGMVLTPPDVISQVMLAIPLWLLFELGILLSLSSSK